MNRAAVATPSAYEVVTAVMMLAFFFVAWWHSD